jgi:hypothetical protein
MGVEFERIVFSGHAIGRMFERSIGVDDVLEVLKSGEVIAEYPDDVPLPSVLMLGFAEGRPLHIVVAVERQKQVVHVITVYDPDPSLWDESFKKRRP